PSISSSSVSTVYVPDGRTLSTALKEKGRLKVMDLRVVRVVIDLRMKGRQEKQRYKDQSRCREREICRFRYDIG
ncbi:MAG: hypothetical protein ACJ8FV_05430, partial [Xanthobacteraceae bacterium]